MSFEGLIPLLALAMFAIIIVILNHSAGKEVARSQSAGRVCDVCGYDLRATPERCPECGTAPSHGLPLLPPLETVSLTTDWPTSPLVPRMPAADEYPVLLFDTEIDLQADLLGEQLRARGIESKVVRGKPVSVSTGYEVRKTRFWKVVIWSGDVDSAIGVVEHFRPTVRRSRHLTSIIRGMQPQAANEPEQS